MVSEVLDKDVSGIEFDELLKVCMEKGYDIKSKETYSQLLDSIMSEYVEPKLIQPTFVIDYPTIISPKLTKDSDLNRQHA